MENTKIEKQISLSAVEGMTKGVMTNLPVTLLMEIEDYQENDIYGKRHSNRTAAMIELIKIGLWFSKKRNDFEIIFKNPELMEELSTQLHEGGLVDFAQRMNWEEFQVVWSIFKTEAKARKMIK